MTIELYAHPFSAYCQKVLIALYENATPFELRMLGPGDTPEMAELAARWPLKRFPVIVDDISEDCVSTCATLSPVTTTSSVIAPTMSWISK